jgi:hypothetical protein
MSITIRFGVDNMVTRQAREYPTVSSILRDPVVRQILGFGDNVEGRVNNAAGQESVIDGDTIDIVSKLNAKG